MRNIFFLIIFFSFSVSQGNTPIILFENSSQAINAVIRDQSYFETFGESPGSGVSEQWRIQTHLKYVEALLRQ